MTFHWKLAPCLNTFNTLKAGVAISILDFARRTRTRCAPPWAKTVSSIPPTPTFWKKEPDMPRKLSSIAPDWWDYTTLDDEIIRAAASLTPELLPKLSRSGFKVVLYETLEDFYLAEALEYINAWRQSTPDNPVGICGPIGPTEQLPLVARIVNELNLSLKSAHFWGMDEWLLDGKEAPVTHPLSFE